jgi:hypothetical protein
MADPAAGRAHLGCISSPLAESDSNRPNRYLRLELTSGCIANGGEREVINFSTAFKKRHLRGHTAITTKSFDEFGFFAHPAAQVSGRRKSRVGASSFRKGFVSPPGS